MTSDILNVNFGVEYCGGALRTQYKIANVDNVCGRMSVAVFVCEANKLRAAYRFRAIAVHVHEHRLRYMQACLGQFMVVILLSDDRT